ncbi:hypothetical protein G4V62_07705 [Bacillaceae bacterium SIJ1]|uniref:hypothetical protein n=1 Tax=Litoribacterium kuwaitense TaxID=1398745 RepID=UPI0013EA2BB3|nr:hypothetical protein [Litoribacterium kuwaitense]NGP44849.1 hypothetical protein [Litoribacterium kuwaitense]
MKQHHITANRKPDKVINTGKAIVRTYGELNTEAFARCLLGMKQKVNKTEKKTA